jgi:protein-arginine kinase
MTHQHQESVEERDWEKRFDKKFVTRGTLGESRFNFFQVSNRPLTEAYVGDEIIEHLKDFIQSEIAQAKKEEREKIVEFLDTRTAKNILASIYLDKSYIDIDNSIIKEIKDFLSEPAPNE